MNRELDVENYLFYFKDWLKRMQKKLNEDLDEYSVTCSHLEYFKLLYTSKSGYSMAELSKKAFVDKALTTRVVRDLEKKGYVYRNTDNLKTRNYNICLTESGIKVAKKIEVLMAKSKKEMQQIFTEEEQEQIFSTLKMIINKVKEEEKE